MFTFLSYWQRLSLWIILPINYLSLLIWFLLTAVLFLKSINNLYWAVRHTVLNRNHEVLFILNKANNDCNAFRQMLSSQETMWPLSKKSMPHSNRVINSKQQSYQQFSLGKLIFGWDFYYVVLCWVRYAWLKFLWGTNSYIF